MKRLGQGHHLVGVGVEQVVGHPLGRPPPDAGQPAEGLDQAFHGFGVDVHADKFLST